MERAVVRRTILVADDDPLIRRLVSTTLESVAGFDIVEAADGAQAVEIARRYEPTIVFLDMDMPRLDGLGALEALRRSKATAEATIVMLTATQTQDAARRAAVAGADLFLTKPFSPLELLTLVHRVGAAQA